MSSPLQNTSNLNRLAGKLSFTPWYIELKLLFLSSCLSFKGIIRNIFCLKTTRPLSYMFWVMYVYDPKCFQQCSNTVKKKKNIILLKVTVRFLWSPVTTTFRKTPKWVREWERRMTWMNLEKHYHACEHFCWQLALSLAMMVDDNHAPTLLHDTTNYFCLHCFDRDATYMAPLSCGCQPCNNLHWFVAAYTEWTGTYTDTGDKKLCATSASKQPTSLQPITADNLYLHSLHC